MREGLWRERNAVFHGWARSCFPCSPKPFLKALFLALFSTWDKDAYSWPEVRGKKRGGLCVLALHVDQTIPNGAQPKRSYILFLVAHSKAFPPCSVNKCLFVFIVLGLNLGLCGR